MVHTGFSMFLQLLDLPELPQDLDVGQKRAIICRELERRKRDAKDVAHTLLRMYFSMNGEMIFHFLLMQGRRKCFSSFFGGIFSFIPRAINPKLGFKNRRVCVFFTSLIRMRFAWKLAKRLRLL
jgi:hypothetical protein